MAASRVAAGAGARDPVFDAIRTAETWNDFSLSGDDLRRGMVRMPEGPRSEVVRTFYGRTPERLGEHRDRYDGEGRLVVTHAQRLVQQRGVTEPLDHARVGRWRTTMTAVERMAFESVAGGLLNELGYEIGA